MKELIEKARRWAGPQVAARQPEATRRWLRTTFFQELIRKTDNYGDVTWLGQPVWQNVLDLWSLQEAIAEIEPAVLLETGTNRGGSALFYANLFDLLGRGRVVTVDIESMHSLEHPRVDFLIGSSIDEEILATMRSAAEAADGPVMVVLDSDHSAAHVLNELRAYGPLVTPGSMMLVQDGVIDTLPMFSGYRPGPLAAIEAYLTEVPGFGIDTRFDRRFLVTHHPSGWLRKHAD
jgi:cephalosporin hydroxylase